MIFLRFGWAPAPQIQQIRRERGGMDPQQLAINHCFSMVMKNPYMGLSENRVYSQL